MEFINVPDQMRKRLDAFYEREGFTSDHEFITQLLDEAKADIAWKESDQYKRIFETTHEDPFAFLAETLASVGSNVTQEQLEAVYQEGEEHRKNNPDCTCDKYCV